MSHCLRPSAIAITGALAIAPIAGMPQRPGGPGQQPGPWNNDIIVVHAWGDGRVEPLATFPRAGVSSIARLADGRLIAAHQHFPENNDADFDKVAVRFSSDEGRTWTGARVIEVANMPDTMRFPFDPTLVPLPDGRVRMYFTSRRMGQADLPAIYSAVSSDGIKYAWESGRRFGIDGRPVIDCAVAMHAGVFHLFAPDNGAAAASGGPPIVPGRAADGIGYHATSADGLMFTRQDDVRVEPTAGRHWLGAAYSDGKSLTFFGTGMGIWMARSETGRAWAPAGILRVRGADPGAVPAKDGGWVVTATGPPVR